MTSLPAEILLACLILSWPSLLSCHQIQDEDAPSDSQIFVAAQFVKNRIAHFGKVPAHTYPRTREQANLTLLFPCCSAGRAVAAMTTGVKGNGSLCRSARCCHAQTAVSCSYIKELYKCIDAKWAKEAEDLCCYNIQLSGDTAVTRCCLGDTLSV